MVMNCRTIDDKSLIILDGDQLYNDRRQIYDARRWSLITELPITN